MDRISKFPNTLNKDDTRKAIGIAFRMWSDVSPLGFTELPPESQTDIDIGVNEFTIVKAQQRVIKHSESIGL
ncbi:UNVERIFIED_CONTAM: hypothetical protein FKN15_008549 [Acipenser sinensis]